MEIPGDYLMKAYEELSRMKVSAAIQEGIRSQDVYRQLNERTKQRNFLLSRAAGVLLSLGLQIFRAAFDFEKINRRQGAHHPVNAHRSAYSEEAGDC
jgi:hypothetical protein